MSSSQLQRTYLQDSNMNNRADLKKESFDRLIVEKGRKVLLETAIQCPCKSPSSNHLATCKNCGGMGWVFIDPRETRMVLTSMDAVTKMQGWSEELRGMVNVTSLIEEELSYMDRITALEADSTYSETLFFKKLNTTLFCYTAYAMKSIEYIAMFDGVDKQLRRLEMGVDYTASGKTIKLTDKYLTYNLKDLSITVRYVYAPTFHVIEMKRETMQSYRLDLDGEHNQSFPSSAYARRAHYQLGEKLNLSGNNLLNNDSARTDILEVTDNTIAGRRKVFENVNVIGGVELELIHKLGTMDIETFVYRNGNLIRIKVVSLTDDKISVESNVSLNDLTIIVQA